MIAIKYDQEYAVERINKSKLEKVCKNKGGSNLELSKRVVTAVNSMKNLGMLNKTNY